HLQARRNIYPFAKDVSTVDDDVADIDTNSKLDPLRLRHARITLGHAALDLHCTAQCVDDTSELCQDAIAGAFDDPSSVFTDFGIDERGSVALQLGKRTLFVGAHQSAVASDISRENGREPSLDPLVGHLGTPQSSSDEAYCRASTVSIG